MKLFRPLITLLLASLAIVAKSQNIYLIPADYSKDTIRACSGILVDAGGANGNYSSGDVGEVYIDPPGDGVVTFTITSFSVGTYGSVLYCYDETNNNWIGTYTNATPPTLNTTIVTSAEVLYFRFYAGFNSNPGFQLSWTTDSTSSPTAAYLSSDTIIPFHTKVDFTNLGSIKDFMTWDFDDGITSNEHSPTHEFNQSGIHNVELKASNCLSSDSVSQVIVVEERPVFDVAPDSIFLVASCGDSVSAGLNLYNLANSGRLITDVALQDTNQSFNANFNVSGDLEGFGGGGNAVTVQTTSTNYAGGKSLRISGKTANNNPVKRTFPAKRPNKVSFAFRGGSYNQRGSFVYLRDDQNRSTFGYVAYDYATAYLTVRFKKNGYTQTNQNFIANPNGPGWVYVSYENINWENKTFDLYLNGSLYIADCEFYSQAQDISVFEVYTNSSNSVCFIDEISFEGDSYSARLSIDEATISGGDTSDVSFSFISKGSVGTQYYDIVFEFNDTVDSKISVPVEVLVDGTGILSSTAGNCPQSYGYTKRVHHDSILLYNSGCDSLRFTSIQGSSSRLRNLVLPMNIAAYDSIVVPYDFFSATSGQFSDTLLITTQDSSYSFCLDLNISDAPILELDTNAYHLYSSHCLDTVSDTMTIYNLGTQNLIWSITQPDTFYFDDFEGASLDTTLWLNLGPGVSISSSCGTISGSKSLSFNGAWGNNRTATTRSLNVIDGATIEFQMYQGSCGQAGANMPMVLQYSLNGTSWTDFAQFHTWEWTTYPLFSATLPDAAKSTNTKVRLIQKVYTTNSNWVVDNFKVIISSNRSVLSSPTSGSVVSGDSQKVALQVYTKGLESGIYDLGIELINGDPIKPLMNLPVTLELEGPSALVYSNMTCFDLDTLLKNTIVVDSILLRNEGCGWTQLDTAWSSDSLFTIEWIDSALAPFDSTYLIINYNAHAVKAVQDSIFIGTTDSLLSLCYEGWVIESPTLTINKDSLTALSLTCQDSVDFEFYVGNSEQNTQLEWSVVPKVYLNVVMVNAHVYASLAENIEDFLEENPLIKIRKVSTVADVVPDLSWADVVIFPPISNSAVPLNYINIESHLQNFVARGGTMVVMGSPNISKILSIDFFNATVGSTFNNQILNVNSFPPYSNGVTSFTAQNAAQSITITHVKPAAQHVVTKMINEHIYSVMDLEEGKLAYFGFTFNQVYDEIKRLFNNLLDDAYSRKSNDFSWLTFTPELGLCSGGDSTKVTGRIISNSFDAGTHEFAIVVTSNDPEQTESILPLHFKSLGEGKLAAVLGCIDLGQMPFNASTNRDVLLSNIGCADVSIQSLFSTDTTISSAAGQGFTISPSDTAAFQLNFIKPSLGLHQDTLKFFSNVDTLEVCIKYESVAAPELSLNPNTGIYTQVNKCMGTASETFVMENTGLDTLNYKIQIGERYDSSFTQEWNYNPSQYSQKLTYVFNNVIDSDTLFYEMIINGAFSGASSRFYIDINGYSYAFFYDNDKPDFTNDTIVGFITGTKLQYALNQGFVKLEVYLFDGAYYTGQYCTMNVYQHNSCSWATLSGTGSGLIDTASQTTRSVTLDPSNLALGTYNTDIFISSNDASKPILKLPLELIVESLPEISLSSGTLNFGTVTNLGGAIDSVLVVNTGCSTLQISNVTSSDNEFIPGWTMKNIAVGNGVWLPVTFTAQTPGMANAVLTIHNNDSVTQINLNANSQIVPTAGFTYQITNACKGKVSFTNTSTAATSYIWDFGNGKSSNSINPNTTFDKPGTYSVKLIAQSVVTNDTISMNVTLSDVLYTHGNYPDTAGLGPILFSDSSLVPIIRQWSFGDGNFSTDSALYHTYSAPGTYFVTLGTENGAGCTATEVRMIFIKNDISIESSSLGDMTVYPVPSTGIVQVQTDNVIESIEVFDAIGSRVGLFIRSPRLDLTDLPAGTYWLLIKGDQWKEIRRIGIVK